MHELIFQSVWAETGLHIVLAGASLYAIRLIFIFQAAPGIQYGNAGLVLPTAALAGIAIFNIADILALNSLPPFGQQEITATASIHAGYPHRDIAQVLVGIFVVVGLITVARCLRNLITTFDKREKFFRAFFDNTPISMYVKDLDSRFLIVNKSHETWLGHSAKDIIGKKVDDFLDDPAVTQKIRDIEKSVAENNEIVETEVQSKKANGQEFSRVVTKFPILSADGAVEYIGTFTRDFTQTRSAERDAAEKSTLLQSILDAAPVEITFRDTETRFVFYNKLMARALGRDAADIIGKTATEKLGPVAGETAETLVREVLRTRQPIIEREFRPARRPDQIQRYTVSPVYDKDGKLLGALTIGQDVTAQHEYQEAIQRSETLLRSIIDNLPATISVKNLDNRYQLVNRQFLKMFNLNSSDTDKMQAGEFLVPDQRHLRKNHEAAVLETGEASTEERFVTLRSGKSYHRLITKFPIRDVDGQIVGLATLGHDISAWRQSEAALRESEERLRSVVDNSPAAISLKNLDGLFILMNRELRQWMNDTDGTMIGTAAQKYLDSDQAKIALAHEKEAVRQGKTIVMERTYTFPDGITRNVLVQKFPINDTHGNCTAVGSVTIDITEQRRIEQQLIQSQKMEAVGQLTGGIAHDFNNMLGVIIGNLDFLAENLAADENLLPLVESATKAALNGATLNSQLLAFSRKQALSPKVIDLKEKVTGMLDILRRVLGESIAIETRLGDGPWTTRVDPAQVESAFLNLAVNARDAMVDGGTLTIEIKTVHLDAEYAANQPDVSPGEYVMLSVEDTGTGISPENLDLVFEPFFTTKDVGQGTGLGLSMVFGFAKQSGGHTEIESTLGTGTTVRIFLPSARQVVEQKTVKDTRMPKANGETVLVVEDDPNLRALVISLLHDLGYKTLEARDGTSALAITDETTALDLILSDIVLPGGRNGREIAAAVKQKIPRIKVLFMSGYPLNAESTPENGNLESVVLQKPFRKLEFACHIRKALSDSV